MGRLVTQGWLHDLEVASRLKGGVMIEWWLVAQGWPHVSGVAT
jgi:hypothetical protein